MARLSDSSRTLLGHLSVLRRSFPLDALVQGLSASRPDWQALLDWSLLRYDPTASTYRLHSLTRLYAQDHLLAELERVQTQAQLAVWYEHYADHDSHSLADYLEAHQLYRASGRVQHAAQLALGLAEVLRRAGLYPLLRGLCAMTVQDMYECDESLMAMALHESGTIALLQGDCAEGHRLYQQSLKMKERLGDLDGQASSLHQLGMIAQQQGDYHEARRLYHLSLELAERVSNVHGQASSLHQLGMIAQQQGDYHEAHHLYRQSLAVFERLGDADGQAQCLHSLGNIAQERGDYAEAHRLLQQSLAIKKQLGDVRGQAQSLHDLGIAAQERRDYAQARHLLQQSLEMKERLGDARGQAVSLHQLGVITQLQGNYTEAYHLLQQSLTVFQRLGDVGGQAHSFGQLGKLAYEQRELEQALTSTFRAFLLFEKLRAPGSAIARTMIARIRDQMDEATFLARWRALAGNLPVPALPQEPSQKEAPSSMTLEDVLNAVVNALSHGTSEKREQLATALVEAQQQLPPSEAALGRFLACLAAALRGETPNLTTLEAPFTDWWQQFEQVLQTRSSEQDQQESE